ncbi:LysR family transcriptional regulator [Amycolatopsis rhabdoformis]|uniref:LysR family transcriptional regulator n=1 Tax=Amycolatopsis rhabdoformis TaxID=1448059 RepID=A0ABZ1IL88_9PSEU|nr:LysR family transcriptional regulator [Amycolatopsis rhabdoformis]WSE34521.1 LysR family transcriptional regulator [Amycolatopsis rhabdoformis]
MLKPLHLLTLISVYRNGSFALAAQELGYTSSAVSQQIAALEKETGLVLFEREAHGVRPTSAARELAERSAPALAALDDLGEQVRRLADGTAGRVRLGSFPTAGVRLVPPALAAFARAVPAAAVTLEEGEPDELVDLVVEGRLDLALVYQYALCPRDWPAELAATPLLHEDLLLLRPRDGRSTPPLPRLTSRRWIASAAGSAGSLSLDRLCAAAGFTPKIAFRSNNYDAVRELVAQTGGVAVVPGLSHVPDDRIDVTVLTQKGAHREVLLVHRRAAHNPLLARLHTALIEAAATQRLYTRPPRRKG